MIDEEEQAEALAAYWTALKDGADTPPSADLVPELARTTNRLHTALRAPKASEAFKRQLQQRLDAELREPARGRSSRPSPALLTVPNRWGWVSLAAVLVLALAGGALLTRQSHSASAQQIIRSAHAVAVASGTAGIGTFELMLRGDIWPGNSGLGGFAGITGTIRIESRYSYQAPNRWRIERRYLSMRRVGSSETTTTLPTWRSVTAGRIQRTMPERVQ
ncbi:MAG: hypothetical protein ACR2JC_06720 [Chloroflexota bacterium]